MLSSPGLPRTSTQPLNGWPSHMAFKVHWYGKEQFPLSHVIGVAGFEISVSDSFMAASCVGI